MGHIWTHPTFWKNFKNSNTPFIEVGSNYEGTYGLGNYTVCKSFAVHTLLWSLEFIIHQNLQHDTIAASNLAHTRNIVTQINFSHLKVANSGTLNLPYIRHWGLVNR